MKHIQHSNLAYCLGKSTDDQPCTSRQARANEARLRRLYDLSDAMKELYVDSDSDESDLDIDSEEEYGPPPLPIDVSDSEVEESENGFIMATVTNDAADITTPTQSPCRHDSEEEESESEDRHDAHNTTQILRQDRHAPSSELSLGRICKERKEYVMNTLGMNERKWKNSANLLPTKHAFTGKHEILVRASESTPLGYFKLFVGDDVIKHIVDQTNKYAADFIRISSFRLKAMSRVHQWVETNNAEMKTFLGLTMLMGIVRKPTVPMYWSKDPLYSTPLYSQVMSRNRYQLLLKFLHLNDNDTMLPKSHPNYDRLHKIRPLLDYFSNKFESVYTPGPHLSLDEAMVLWKGMLSFKQFIRNKHTRFGIKVFQLCEDTGYTCKFEVYTGSGMIEDTKWSKTENLVLRIVSFLRRFRSMKLLQKAMDRCWLSNTKNFRKHLQYK